jgi:predicted Zn-dependent protease
MTRKQRNRRVAARWIILLGAIFFVLPGCSTSSLTPIGEQGFQLEEDEQRIWREARELQKRFDQSGLIDEDPVLHDYINQLAGRIAPEKFKEQVRMEVKVLKHPAPNAFALPHGPLYIHSGFLARMDSEAQLAAVLGHEMSHVVYRHTLQTFRSVKQGAAFTSTLAVIGAPAGIYGLGVVLLGSVGALAAVSGYAQGLEEEADGEGLRIMARAGYDPHEAVRVMESLKTYLEQEEIKEPFFFSTHPRVEERIGSYRRIIAREFADPEGRQGKEEFTTKTARALLENALLEISRGRFTAAQEGIEKSLARDPTNSRAHFALAELFRQRSLDQDRVNAESEYKITIDLEPGMAEAHRGIGLLYYSTDRMKPATEHLRTYLELSPAAKDRAYIEQYLRKIDPGGMYP